VILRTALRVVLAAEFVGALVTWAFKVAPWWLCDGVATMALVGFMLTFGEDWTPCTPPSRAGRMDRRRRQPWAGEHVAHEGPRGFWCGGPGSHMPCYDCAPSSRGRG
jgi:hypothetical protein